jgi:hypothetical protein
MQKVLTGLGLAAALGAPAWGQTTWSTDRFTVSTANGTAVEIADGAVQLPELPQSFANAGANPGRFTSLFNLTFAPRAGYALAGERVTFAVDMILDVFDRPTDLLLKPFGQFDVDIDGLAPISRSIDAGTLHFRGDVFLGSPTFNALASALAMEGLACPLGSGANDCDFGTDFVPLDATVWFRSFTLTPVLSAVPEPGPGSAFLFGLVVCSAGAAARSRGGRNLPAN